VRKVSNSFGEDAENENAGLDSTFRVVGVKALVNRDASNRGRPITELCQAALGIETAQERRCRSSE